MYNATLSTCLEFSAYDANGNMTQRGSDTLAYDYENRLTAYKNSAG
jgi:hypothetical protein